MKHPLQMKCTCTRSDGYVSQNIEDCEPPSEYVCPHCQWIEEQEKIMDNISAIWLDFMAADKLTPEELQIENRHKCWVRR